MDNDYLAGQNRLAWGQVVFVLLARKPETSWCCRGGLWTSIRMKCRGRDRGQRHLLLASMPMTGRWCCFSKMANLIRVEDLAGSLVWVLLLLLLLSDSSVGHLPAAIGWYALSALL